MAKKNVMSDADHAKKQKEAAEAREAAEKAAATAPFANAEPTSAGHVGKHADEEHKEPLPPAFTHEETEAPAPKAAKTSKKK